MFKSIISPLVIQIRQQSVNLNKVCTIHHAAVANFGAQNGHDQSIQKVEDQLPGISRLPVDKSSIGRLFAVVHIAGRQRKITAEDIIVVDKPIEADVGESIIINKVLLVGGKDFTMIGRPVLNNVVKVEATVMEKTLSQTIVSFWYKKRKDYSRTHLRKEFYTFLRINNIELLVNETNK